MKKLFSILAAVGFILSANAAMAAVAGSPHEYGSGAAYGMCEVCHIPHAAQTGARIWRESVTIAHDTTWDNSTVGALCGTCHNGGPLNATNNRYGAAPHSVNATAYDETNAHGRAVADLTNAPAAGGVGDSFAATQTKPYTTGTKPEAGLIECTSCHDPHVHDVRPFLRPGVTDGATVSGFCVDCHSERYNNTVVATATTNRMHPINVLYANDPDNQGTTFRATPAAAMITLVDTKTSASPWTLGGKFEGALTAAPGSWATANIGCGTCHAVHNPAATTGNAAYQGLHLLAIDNTGATAALCQGCHGGPANGTPVGSIAGDHPIDMDPGTGGGPTIDKWIGTVGSTTRYERSPNRANWWPVGGDVVTGNIVCTSCHSAHNSGSDMGRLTRDLFTGSGAGTLFCQACHGDPSPAGHHSNEYNWNGSNYNLGVTPATLGVNCFDCHGGGGSFGAHNGFGFTFTAAQNQLSELCVSCHLDAGAYDDWTRDPAFNYNYPNGHLAGARAGSHYLGSFTDDANSIHVKRSTWTSGETSFSKFGADTHGAVTDTTGDGSVGKGQMICESCHSVLYNAGAVQAAPTQSSGYMINLLLQNYEDDSDGTPAIGSGFCVACHNQTSVGDADGPVSDATVEDSAVAPLNMHPMTAWSITKAQDTGRNPVTLITGGATYATAATAIANGGALATGESYPALNAMDCDSCHRPHRADITGGTIPNGGGCYDQTKAGGAGVDRPVILETAGPAAREFDALCLNCHGY